jgi:hypothetical protein
MVLRFTNLPSVAGAAETDHSAALLLIDLRKDIFNRLELSARLNHGLDAFAGILR